MRTRIVAIIIVLLTTLGIAVGGTAEIFLRKQLYDQLDTRLDTAMHPVRPSGGGNYPQPGNQQRRGGFDPTLPFLGSEIGSIAITYDPDTGEVDDKTGIVSTRQRTDGTFEPTYNDLTSAAETELVALNADGAKHDIEIHGYGSYRVIAEGTNDGKVRVIALKLDTVHSTLLRVALVIGGALLIALAIAGWAGALIVRSTLQPLRRVASTAARVSELRLDRGEVQLAQRVPEADTDPGTEVGQVGAALNRLLDHVGNALEARHASEMQVRQFVADASHELRTPLAAIRGYAELSRRSRAPISEEIAHVLNRVESEAKRMTLLVEDLLLLARLDAGRPLAHEPVDLTMLVVDAVSDAHAAGPSHYWQLDLPEEPVTVIGDGARLHQVLANLLANARTHTPDGTAVTVSVRAGDGSAVLHVIDSGPGIPAELQPHIFERFARGDSSRSRAAGSTGLGLSIVHAVVTAHRGRVSVQSVPGQTVFTVVLPLVPPDLVPTAGPQLAQRAR
jgi:two-component system OmpR family sensor kinase